MKDRIEGKYGFLLSGHINMHSESNWQGKKMCHTQKKLIERWDKYSSLFENAYIYNLYCAYGSVHIIKHMIKI